jgi:uncharacterized protein (TIGR00299 family) protein
MSILYLDLVGGIAGDMTVAALIDLGVPLEHLRQGLARLGVEGIAIAAEPGERHAIRGTRFIVTHPLEPSGRSRAGRKGPAASPAGHRRGHGSAHAAGRSHGPGGAHPRPYREVREIVARAGLSARAEEMAQRVFARLAEAEGAVHGVPVEEVILHEVGAWDSIADVVCAALALDYLEPEAIFCSPVPLGAGTVRTGHGLTPIPGPATLALLKGFPVETGGARFERTTPTGAAILAALARPAPEPLRFVPERIGVGLGTLDPPEVPNLLRAVLGRAEIAPERPAPVGALRDTIECAEANLDDANPQWIGYLMERLFAAGALDVVLIPVHMKKNRPGTLVQALYAPALRPAIEAAFFAESTTLGVRYRLLERTALPRERTSVRTPWGEVAGKLARGPAGQRFAPEFEECRRIAEREGIPLQEVYRAAQAAFGTG